MEGVERGTVVVEESEECVGKSVWSMGATGKGRRGGDVQKVCSRIASMRNARGLPVRPGCIRAREETSLLHASVSTAYTSLAY